ncbi:MAG: nonstructural protein [Microvirus sp.]|nr:MAG: nonstructural protein [Microvirus sp.]
MNLYLCSVFDRATESFGRPFVVQHPGQAVRSFSDEANNKDSELGRHPADYELWQLGVMSDQDGVLSSHKERLARASDFVTPTNKA